MKLFEQKHTRKPQEQSRTQNRSQIDGISAQMRRLNARIIALEDTVDTLVRRINRQAVRASVDKKEAQEAEREPANVRRPG